MPRTIAGRMDAMEYLLGLGHRRIGFISGRAELESTNRRLRGYRDALEGAGVPIDESLIAPGDYTTETGATRARQLLSLEGRPTAIFASNDQSGHGRLSGWLRRWEGKFRRTYRWSASTTSWSPSTWVDHRGPVHFGDGLCATRMLIRLIKGELLESQTYVTQTQLVIRNSCRAIAPAGCARWYLGLTAYQMGDEGSCWKGGEHAQA